MTLQLIQSRRAWNFLLISVTAAMALACDGGGGGGGGEDEAPDTGIVVDAAGDDAARLDAAQLDAAMQDVAIPDAQPPGPDVGAPDAMPDAAPPDAAPLPIDCAGYCTLMAQACGDVFDGEETCLATCATYADDGEEGDAEGDTLQCRISHAGAALDDATAHCPSAAPSGGGVCGDTCEIYCGLVGSTCTGEHALYPDEAACLNACSQFPTDGQAGATTGDSVQCRIYHGGAPALAAPEIHCAHAAPAGGGMCGDYCEIYCDLTSAHCSGDNAIHDDREHCLTGCAELATDGGATVTEGDSVQCRIYHASFPAEGDPATHCARAALHGGGVCSPGCAEYCGQMMSACDGIFADVDACLATCATYPAEWTSDGAVGNSLQCRLHHVGLASETDPEVHCPRAAPSGGGVCGRECDVYCDLVEANCDGDHALYADRDGCMTACAGFPVDGVSGAATGDSIQCRIHHAGVPAAAEPAVHCPSAGRDGAGVCFALPQMHEEPDSVEAPLQLYFLDGEARADFDISPEDDVDWFRFEIAEARPIAIYTRAVDPDEECGGDTVIELWAEGGDAPIAADDDAGPGTCSAISPVRHDAVNPLPAGRYIVRVATYAGGRPGVGNRLYVDWATPLELGALCDPGRERTVDCVPEGYCVLEAPEGAPAVYRCVAHACHDGHVGPAEACDNDDDPACVDCVVVAPQRGAACDPDGVSCMADDDYCRPDEPDSDVGTCTEHACGDGVVWDGHEECDSDDPGCLACAIAPIPVGGACFIGGLPCSEEGYCGIPVGGGAEECLEHVCGDGLRARAEECDNFGADQDVCDADCRVPIDLPRNVEPDDRDHPYRLEFDADGVATVLYTNYPRGDEDWFRFTLDDTYHVSIETRSWSGVGCEGDTVLELFAAGGDEALTSDDEGGQGTCSRIAPGADRVMSNMAAGDYDIRASSYFGNLTGVNSITVIRSSQIQVGAACEPGDLDNPCPADVDAFCGPVLDPGPADPPFVCRVHVCGDGIIGPSEACDMREPEEVPFCVDDCTAVLDPVVEPDTRQTPTDLVFEDGLATSIFRIGQAGDEDWWRFTLDEPADVAIWTRGAFTGLRCNGDTVIDLFAGGGAEAIATNDDAPGTVCSSIDPLDHRDVMGPLAAGTYIVRTRSFTALGTTSYNLLFVRQIRAPGIGESCRPDDRFVDCPPGAYCGADADDEAGGAVCVFHACGDGVVGPDEECDEPDNPDCVECVFVATRVPADGGTFEVEFEAGDSAQFEFALDAPTQVTYWTDDGDGGCPAGVDTLVEIRRFVADDGVEIVSPRAVGDDDGPGLCSAEILELGPGEYRLGVYAPDDFAVAGVELTVEFLSLVAEGAACDRDRIDNLCVDGLDCLITDGRGTGVCGEFVLPPPSFPEPDEVIAEDVVVEELTIPAAVNGHVDGESEVDARDGEVDVFVLRLDEPSQLVVWTEDRAGACVGIDTRLAMIDPDRLAESGVDEAIIEDNVFAYNDDAAGTSCSRLELLVPDGTYTFAVWESVRDAAMDYSVWFTALPASHPFPPTPAEPIPEADDLILAPPIAVIGRLGGETGAFEGDGEVDVFAVEVERPERVRVWITENGVNCPTGLDFDPILYWIDNDTLADQGVDAAIDNALWTNNDGGDGFCSQIEVDMWPGETYYFALSELGRRDALDYWFHVSQRDSIPEGTLCDPAGLVGACSPSDTCWDPEVDFGATDGDGQCSSATEISDGGQWEGTFGSRGVDVYWLKLDEPALVTASTSAAADGHCGVAPGGLDTRLRLFRMGDDGLDDIAFNDDVGGGNFCSAVSERRLEPGEYAFEVRSYFPDGIDAYLFDVDVVPIRGLQQACDRTGVSARCEIELMCLMDEGDGVGYCGDFRDLGHYGDPVPEFEGDGDDPGNDTIEGALANAYGSDVTVAARLEPEMVDVASDVVDIFAIAIGEPSWVHVWTSRPGGQPCAPDDAVDTVLYLIDSEIADDDGLFDLRGAIDDALETNDDADLDTNRCSSLVLSLDVGTHFFAVIEDGQDHHIAYEWRATASALRSDGEICDVFEVQNMCRGDIACIDDDGDNDGLCAVP